MSARPASAHRLFLGHVGHRRAGQVQHGFHYPVFFLGLDVDALDGADARPRSADARPRSASARPVAALPWPLALDRPGLLSVRRRDYGPRDGSPLGAWVRGIAARAGLPPSACERLMLHTFPRVLGWGFNPVNFWLCLDGQSRACALVAEVNNTFGEHHAYLVAHADGRPLGEGPLPEARKVFHVSPFFPVEGSYRFSLRHGAQGLQVRIAYQDGQGQALTAYLQGQAHECTPAALLQAWAHHPLQTLMVVSRIHWHALRLWRKGVRFHRKPAPPHEEVSLGRR